MSLPVFTERMKIGGGDIELGCDSNEKRSWATGERERKKRKKGMSWGVTNEGINKRIINS